MVSHQKYQRLCCRNRGNVGDSEIVTKIEWMKESREERSKGGRKQGRKEARKEASKGGSKEGSKRGSKEGSKEGENYEWWVTEKTMKE